jgi:hypothetical protein
LHSLASPLEPDLDFERNERAKAGMHARAQRDPVLGSFGLNDRWRKACERDVKPRASLNCGRHRQEKNTAKKKHRQETPPRKRAGR